MGRVFLIAAIIFRVLGFLLALLVIINFSGWLLIHSHMSMLSYTISHLMPDIIAGKWIVPTPLDGLFRTDFAISACVMFVLDWICCMLRKALGH